MSSGASDFPLTEVLAWTIVHSTWQGALTLGACLLARRLTESPSLRYRLSLVCLLSFVLLQIATFAACAKWRVGEGVTIPVRLTTADSEPPLTQDLNAFGHYRPVELPEESWIVAMGRSSSPLVFWLGLLWVLGFWIYCIRYAAGMYLLRRELNRCVPLAAEETQQYEQLARQIAVRRPVRFLTTRELSVPATCGWMKPAVLLPDKSLLTLPIQYLHAIILHELAHIRRHDSLTHFFRQIVHVVYFFHPMMAMIATRMTDDSEKAADEIASHAVGNKHHYLEALVHLEEARVDEMKLGASGGSLKDRVMHLIADREAARQGNGRFSITMLALCALLLFMTCNELIARGTSPAQQALAWASDRDLAESVLDAFEIDRSIDVATPALRRALDELDRSGRVEPATLDLVADSLLAGVPADRFVRVWSDQCAVPYLQRPRTRFDGIGSSNDRTVLKGLLTRRAETSRDPTEQRRYARAAFVLMSLNLTLRGAVGAQAWFYVPQNQAMLQLDDETRLHLDTALSLHSRRTSFEKDVLNGLARADDDFKNRAFNAISFVPDVQLTFCESATSEDWAALRTFLKTADEPVRRRWAALHSRLHENPTPSNAPCESHPEPAGR